MVGFCMINCIIVFPFFCFVLFFVCCNCCCCFVCLFVFVFCFFFCFFFGGGYNFTNSTAIFIHVSASLFSKAYHYPLSVCLCGSSISKTPPLSFMNKIRHFFLKKKTNVHSIVLEKLLH